MSIALARRPLVVLTCVIVVPDAVNAFQRPSLGRLGRVPTADALVFVRTGEQLMIAVDRAQGRTDVHVSLEPG